VRPGGAEAFIAALSETGKVTEYEAELKRRTGETLDPSSAT